MRTREEIENLSIQDYRAGMVDTDQLVYILEVLLDIRDLLKAIELSQEGKK